ncbi:MAG TPA: hypothetical protein VMZ29_15170 [Candidatus Bathyarchaeia archaeon]|nr:hypothetical protein [Candidatus Bathyarchaeia archaeon]
MKMKDFFLALFIILIATLIFSLPIDTRDLLLPTLLFSGVLGGIYVGYKRKRPLVSCFYDGFLIGLPSGFLQAAIVVPLYLYYHELIYELTSPIQFILLTSLACIMLGGFVGAPFGGLLMGLFYRYLKIDRGEGDLYETYLGEKTKKSNKKDLND